MIRIEVKLKNDGTMLIKTRGIILKSIKYGESSLIQDIYTEEYGLKSYIISGVRNKKKGNKAGMLQVMSLIELVAYNKQGNGLNRIKEFKAEKVYQSLPFDIVKSSIGLFITEVTRRSISQNEQHNSLFSLLHDSFIFLEESTGSIALFPIIFLLKLSSELGIAPANNYNESRPVFDILEGQFCSIDHLSAYTLSAEASQYLYSLQFENFGISDQFTVPKKIRLELLNKLVDFYRLHVDNFGKIKSLDILHELFS